MGTEAAALIAVKIDQTEQRLRYLDEEFRSQAGTLSLAETNARVIAMAGEMTRRRTLIECWELVSGRVWPVEAVASQP